MAREYPTLLELVGNTPLVQLQNVAPDGAATVLGKLEFLNPGGSIKDRIAITMVERAEREGKLKPGGTIVEPTSGNTGTGLAIVAALKGYRCIFTMPDKMSREKISLLKAFGAEVIICPYAVEPEPPGLSASTLATSWGTNPAPRRESRTSGVPPMASRIESLMSTAGAVVVARIL